jgi:hypothetical protein
MSATIADDSSSELSTQSESDSESHRAGHTSRGRRTYDTRSGADKYPRACRLLYKGKSGSSLYF